MSKPQVTHLFNCLHNIIIIYHNYNIQLYTNDINLVCIITIHIKGIVYILTAKIPPFLSLTERFTFAFPLEPLSLMLLCEDTVLRPSRHVTHCRTLQFNLASPAKPKLPDSNSLPWLPVYSLPTMQTFHYNNLNASLVILLPVLSIVP